MVNLRKVVLKQADCHADLTKVSAFKDEKYDVANRELELDIFETTPEKSFRLVHDGEKILDLFESEGVTSTIWNIFTGTEDECQAEIKKFGLEESVATKEQ